LGGDADTIGAMTGAIAGAHWGIEAIPQRWQDKLENGKFIWQIKNQGYVKVLMKKFRKDIIDKGKKGLDGGGNYYPAVPVIFAMSVI